jgi:hypothetical protein
MLNNISSCTHQELHELQTLISKVTFGELEDGYSIPGRVSRPIFLFAIFPYRLLVTFKNIGYRNPIRIEEADA